MPFCFLVGSLHFLPPPCDARDSLKPDPLNQSASCKEGRDKKHCIRHALAGKRPDVHGSLDFSSVLVTVAGIMNSLTSLSPQQLRRAADIQERILDLQTELNSILGASAPADTTAAPGKRRRRMSAAGRAAIAAAARARWAKIKGAKTSAAQMPKRKMSAAGRARLSAMAKARWRKAKARGRKRL
jgi:hypothetical protein